MSTTSELLAPRLRDVSHAVAFVLSVSVAVVLIVLAPAGRATVAAVMYGAGLIALFGGSALYHRWPGFSASETGPAADRPQHDLRVHRG